jgi:ParB family transcriptional regulator, chromosome partitioning protein
MGAEVDLMVSRNIFQPPPPPAPVPETAAEEARARFPNTGTMSGVKSTLRDLSTNAVREIDPILIEEGGPRDRLAIVDADVADLAESIRVHGQQVPIMVRPLPDSPGRFRIVYGRRRLRALKLAGLPAKALVRSLTDEQAVLAQGQENSLRLDPSFIEKALFATELADAGYEPPIILDALAIDKPMLSRMTKVARTIPPTVIRFVGPAHGIGRRRWEELADLMRVHPVDLDALSELLSSQCDGVSSDTRFSRLHEMAAKAVVVSTEKGGGSPALLTCH